MENQANAAVGIIDFRRTLAFACGAPKVAAF
jgi:hypothetical protein